VICKKKAAELVEKVGRPNTYLMGTIDGMEIGSLVTMLLPPFPSSFRAARSHEASLDEDMHD